MGGGEWEREGERERVREREREKEREGEREIRFALARFWKSNFLS